MYVLDGVNIPRSMIETLAEMGFGDVGCGR